MKNVIFLFLLATLYTNAQSIWINELHYDNNGADLDEQIEIAGESGTDLEGYKLILINGNTSSSYGSVSLSGVIPNEQNGFGTLSFTPSVSIQNGSPDGVALVDPSDVWLQFLSYEGVITVEGVTSVDIGVEEGGGLTEVGQSLQLQGSGSGYSSFSWSANVTATPGSINTGQTFYPLDITDHSIELFSVYPNPTHHTFSINSALKVKQVEVFSILGKVVLKSKLQATFEVSNLNKGLYFVKVIFENNATGTKKLFID